MLQFLLQQIEPRQRVLLVGILAGFCAGMGAHLAAGLDAPEAAYAAVRLFLVEADVGVGRDGPAWLRALLWAVRFGAPVLSLGFLAETAHLFGLFHLPTLFFRMGRRGRGHVVVVGLGRLGRHLCERLDARGLRVVAVERDPENPEIVEVRRLGIPVIVGDARVRGVLEQARIGEARKIVAVTADDLVNLDIALAALGGPDASPPEALAHVADPIIGAHLARTRAAAGPDARRHPRPINAYDWAAEALVDTRLGDVGANDLFVVAGFGRFGRAVLRRLLHAHGAGPGNTFWVVDPRLHPGELAGPAWTCLAGGDRVRTWAHDMLSPTLLAEVDEVLRGRRRVHFLVCTDDDAQNLRFAFRILGRADADASLSLTLRVFGSLDARRAHDAFARVNVVEFVELLRDRRPAELPELGERRPSAPLPEARASA